MRKKYYNSLRGPGTYPVDQRDTSFNILARQEQHQCFNSTSNRFGGDGVNNAAEDEVMLGPGFYDAVKDVFSSSVSHNRTFTSAFLSKRPDNIFGIKDFPGP
jgi:hypothetical protein